MGIEGDRLIKPGVNTPDGLVPPCLYRPNGTIDEIVPFRGTLTVDQVRTAIGGAYQVVPMGDNFIALSTGNVMGEYNPIVSDLCQGACYGPALIGHRSFFTGGA